MNTQTKPTQKTTIWSPLTPALKQAAKQADDFLEFMVLDLNDIPSAAFVNGMVRLRDALENPAQAYPPLPQLKRRVALSSRLMPRAQALAETLMGVEALLAGRNDAELVALFRVMRESYQVEPCDTNEIVRGPKGQAVQTVSTKGLRVTFLEPTGGNEK